MNAKDSAASTPPAKGGPPKHGALAQRGLAGLTDAEAQLRLQQDGPNELPSQRRRGVGAIILEVVREPMFLLLVAGGALYLLMGEPFDALILFGFVGVVIGITVVQARRTDRALEVLRDLSSPRALVVRGGQHRRIAGRDVVRGDLLVLAEGDRVPADAILRRASNLAVDESLLSGESVPVRKAPSTTATALDRPGGDGLPSLFSGTLVTTGQGMAEVAATGARSELGKIGRALQQVKPEATRLQRETSRLVRTLAIVGLSLCVVVVVAYALLRGGGAAVWKEGLLAGIAMAMAILPEEFPVVLTVFLALGAWRISRSRVLTRRMPAVETLGATTVLCVDKTGTLTMNQMTVRRLMIAGREVDLPVGAAACPSGTRTLLESATLASRREAFDPMERALHAAAETAAVPAHPDWVLAREYPLSSELLAMSQAWQPPGEGEVMVASKGAPEAVAELCRLSPAEREALGRDVAALASQGLRVLAVARGRGRAEGLPARHRDLSLELVGLVALEDPLRSTVPDAVAECQTAGVRVVMITGDYPITAQSIARQAGLKNCDDVVTGPELERMTDAELADRVRTVQVFARVVPEQKLRIVMALRANHEVVAMTGDGVNDAPALKAAHIGIAMGGRGTDVAREAASLVLLDDDFSSIVAAVSLGRRIFDNIKKAVGFTFAVHVPIAGLSMLPVFIRDWPLLLLPVHIVFLELVIDPACSLIFEAERAEPDVMKRPPRDSQERLFSLRDIGLSLLQGAGVLAVCVGVLLLVHGTHPTEAARAATFTTLVVAFVMIILASRSRARSAFSMMRQRNPALWWIAGGTAMLLGLVLGLPPARTLFRFAALDVGDLGLAVAAGLACLAWCEGLKVAWRVTKVSGHRAVSH
jgi:Ca2+-transporting ATPase